MPADSVSASKFHGVVWIDRSEARIFYFSMAEPAAVKATLHPTSFVQYLHQIKSEAIDSGNVAEDKPYLSAIAAALAGAAAILITGPANEKIELFKYLCTHNPQIANRVAGVETADHPTDSEVVAHARSFFKSANGARP